MSNHSRRKGSKNERAIVRLLQEHGFAAEKISRSGYTGTDISIPLIGRDHRVEAKVRGTGFRQLYDWLDGADILIVKSDRREMLVVLPLRLAIEIAKIAEARRNA